MSGEEVQPDFGRHIAIEGVGVGEGSNYDGGHGHGHRHGHGGRSGHVCHGGHGGHTLDHGAREQSAPVTRMFLRIK